METNSLARSLSRSTRMSRTQSQSITHAPDSDRGSSSEHDDSEAFDFLRSLREFRELPSSELKLLANNCRFANYAAGENIEVEGDEQGLCGFIIVSGLVAMIKTSINGKELIVGLLHDKDTFGLLLTLAEVVGPTQLSARPFRRTRVLMVPILQFTQLLKLRPELFRTSVHHLILCLQSSYSLSRGLAHDRVEVRIAAILYSLAIKYGESLIFKGSYTVKFTRQQLADLTGTTAETAIRVTRAMQRDEILDISRPGIIRVLKLDALRALVEG
jgi:CRP-like cAMP-binding protein